MSAPYPASPPPAPEVLERIRAAVGPKGVIEGADRDPHLTEWRGTWRGETPLLVAPADTAQVAAVVKLCAEAGVAITPQGGNTGLVGGQIPFGHEILLSLKRLNRIRDVSALDNTMTCEAGVTLAAAQEAAKEADRLFPLSLGSEGTCQIGGVISTNAGGVHVLRYGNTRDLVLGIEAVTPSGEVWNGLRRLRKDNTGYDLKQLFIGAEGTLGVVTAATLKLFPRPREVCVAFAAVRDPAAAVELLSRAQEATGGLVSSFELIPRMGLEFDFRHIPNTRDPLSEPHAWYVLVEFSAGRAAGLRESMEAFLSGGFEAGLVLDAAIAENETQAEDFWRLRHALSESMRPENAFSKHDVSVSVADVPAFLTRADEAVAQIDPALRVVAFGHMGDGNIHYDVCAAEGRDAPSADRRAALYARVHEIVAQMGGSISAEHGIGRLKRDELAQRKTPVEMAMMRAVKAALDPKGLMNPGKLL